MNVKLLVVGKTNEAYLNVGIDEYTKRLGRYTSFQMEVIPDVKVSKKLSAKEVKEKEGKEILKRIQGSKTVLLDEQGKEYTSIRFSKFLEKEQMIGTKTLCFVIGGAFGFSEEVYKASQGKIALSQMTFTHQMIRLLFIEQLYRGFTIIKGEKYHHL